MVRLHIDKVPYMSKPAPKDIAGRINKEIIESTAEVTPEELAELFATGYTAVLGLHHTSRKKDNLISQEVLALDFDNTYHVDKVKYKATGNDYMSIEKLLNHEFIAQNASFIYKTFSYEEEWEKFRVVFILDKPITDTNEVTHYYKELMEIFPQADASTKDSSRIFFGGTEAIPIEFRNTLDLSVLQEYIPTKKAPAKVSKVVKEAKVNSKPAKVKVETKETPTWLLISRGDKELVKARLGDIGSNIIVPTLADSVEVIKSISMQDILGIHYNPFKDIFGNDEHASCGIHKIDGGTYLYTKQNSTGKNGNLESYNIIQVIQKLLSNNPDKPVSPMFAIDYLVNVLGITVKQTENLATARSEATYFKNVLLSNDLKEAYPSIYQLFGRYKYQQTVNAIIDIFLMSIYEDRETGEIKSLSWISERNLAKRIGVSERKITRLLNLLATVGAVHKLDNATIPKSLLEQLEMNRTHYKDSNGEWIPRDKAKQRRSSVYELPLENFSQIIERCDDLVEKGFTIKALSREYLLRTFGVERANEVYPQDKARGISKQSQEITMDIHRAILTRIEENGYAIVNEVKAEVEILWKSKGFTNYKYQQALGEVKDMYGLTKKSLTNELKAKFGISHLSPQARPTILLPAE